MSRADPAVLKGISQLLLVIGGLFGVAVWVCTGIAVLLHAPPLLPQGMAHGMRPLVLLSVSCVCALLGAGWIRADRKKERRNRPPPSVGPAREPGHFSARELKPGTRYRVTQAFVDFDGQSHPVGESWRYVSRHFLPYEAGLTLNLLEAGSMSTIRLQDYPETQGQLIGRFHEYVCEEPETEASGKGP